MFTDKVDLYKYFNITRPENGAGYLNVYVPAVATRKPNRIRPAMLVIAGGGYADVSEREKECVALTYLAQSYVAFTLEYSIAPVKYPAQLNEGLMAMIYIKENAEKFGVDKNHVAAIGFSAGGHLCAMLANLSGSEDAKNAFGDKALLARPDAVVLSYPVITSGEKAHRGSFVNLCGNDVALAEKLSLEKRVTEKSSPAFIWTTANDGLVPSENSLYYALACKTHNVPFELHVFADGQHGLSLCNDEVYTINEPVREWIGLSLTWLKNRGFTITDVD